MELATAFRKNAGGCRKAQQHIQGPRVRPCLVLPWAGPVSLAGPTEGESLGSNPSCISQDSISWPRYTISPRSAGSLSETLCKAGSSVWSPELLDSPGSWEIAHWSLGAEQTGRLLQANEL
jgi:hypothetical protein